jgi:hypothetical protein
MVRSICPPLIIAKLSADEKKLGKLCTGSCASEK